MPPPRRGKGKGKGKFGKDKKDRGQRALFRRRKFCRFTAEKAEWIDYVFHVYLYAAVTCSVLTLLWAGGWPYLSAGAVLIGVARDTLEQAENSTRMPWRSMIASVRASGSSTWWPPSRRPCERSTSTWEKHWRRSATWPGC